MDDERYLMIYPAFLIGQPPEPGKPEQIAVRMVDGQSALPIFTETLLAERFMDAEGFSAGVIGVPSTEHRENFIRRYRDQLEFVLVDPNPVNNRATVLEVDSFLSQLES